MYVSTLAKQLECDETELEEIIKNSGFEFEMDYGVMTINDEDVENISNMWDEIGKNCSVNGKVDIEESVNKKDYLFVLNGRNGTVKVTQKVVIISREGIIGFFSSRVRGQGEKRILIKSIISVELGKEPSFMGGVSYIRFATAADKEIRVSHFSDPDMKWFENKGSQYFNDPNTIQLSSMEQYETALKIREYIENYQSDRVDSAVMQPLSGADEILKYKKLLDDGILTQDEFDAKKKQLLGL